MTPCHLVERFRRFGELAVFVYTEQKERRREGRPIAAGQGHDLSSVSKHYSRLSSPHDSLAAVLILKMEAEGSP